MALADTSAGLKDTSAALRVSLEAGASSLRDALDNHLARVDSLIADVAAVASAADSPVVAAAAGALHVPAEILDGFARSLTAVAAAWPKPQDAVPEAPAEPAQPEAAADPQPAEGEQAA